MVDGLEALGAGAQVAQVAAVLLCELTGAYLPNSTIVHITYSLDALLHHLGAALPTRTTWPGEHLEQLGDISPRIDWPPTCPPRGHHLPILQCTSGPKLPLLLSSSDAKLSSWPYLELSN